MDLQNKTAAEIQNQIYAALVNVGRHLPKRNAQN